MLCSMMKGLAISALQTARQIEQKETQNAAHHQSLSRTMPKAESESEYLLLVPTFHLSLIAHLKSGLAVSIVHSPM